MYTFEEAVHFLEQIPKYSIHPGRENAEKLLAQLDHPEASLQVIHVAGTNGKGSVCAFLADMLTARGKRVGLFVSPHLIDPRERIQLNRQMISKDDFLACFLRVEAAVKALEEQGYEGITYFDYFFAIAMCYYETQNTDYCVLETGLGGRCDATNAIAAPVLTIITSISMDHTEVLGDTLEKIAEQKAGILKPGVPLVYCSNNPTVCEVLKKAAFQAGCIHLGVSRSNCTFLSLKDEALTYSFRFGDFFSLLLQVNSSALYQMENGAIAYVSALLLYLLEQGKLPDWKQYQTSMFPEDLLSTLKNALAHSCWAGRMEQVAPDVFIDGAHNADGIRMLLASMRLLTKTTPSILLFTAAKEKDTNQMIREICASGLFRHIILTTLDNPRAIPAAQLKQTFEQYTRVPITISETAADAFSQGISMKKPGELFLSAGSLYLVGAIKEFLLR